MEKRNYIVCWKDGKGKEDKDTVTRYTLDEAKNRIQFLNNIYMEFTFWYEPIKKE